MTSNVNTQPNGQSVQSAKAAPATNAATHAPSVPISLYREVASELQTTRTTLQSLKTQNQELIQKNQQLRLEIERVVQSALHLRQVADSSWGMPNFIDSAPSFSDSVPNLTSTKPENLANSASTLSSANSEASHKGAPLKEAIAPSEQPKLRTEQLVQPLQPQTEPSAEISTWWLILLVCFIVITAFGTGFLLVRPLLPSR